MDFFEAKEIAKANPGSTIRRDEQGVLGVWLADGTRLTQSANIADLELTPLRRETARLRQALYQRGEVYQRLVNERERKELHFREEYSSLEEELRKVRTELKIVKTKLSQLREEDWALLSVINSSEGRARSEAIVANRHTMTYMQIRGILDHLDQFEFSPEDVKTLEAELRSKAPPTWTIEKRI